MFHSMKDNQEAYLNSLICQRLHDSPGNRTEIGCFMNYDNDGLVRDLRLGWNEDTKGETVTDEFFSAAEEHVQPEPAPKEEVIVQDETAEKPVAKKARAAKKVETPAATVEDDFFN